MKKMALIALAGMAALVAGGLTAGAAGLRLNTTTSLPLGLYRIAPLDAAGPKRGELVVFCLPEAGAAASQAVARAYLPKGKQWGRDACPHGLAPLMKPVVALPGDTVADAGPYGLAVNGAVLPNSARVEHDPRGRPLAKPARTTYTVAAGQLVAVAPESGSFDSRYLGPVPFSALRGAAVPLLTW